MLACDKSWLRETDHARKRSRLLEMNHLRKSESLSDFGQCDLNSTIEGNIVVALNPSTITSRDSASLSTRPSHRDHIAGKQEHSNWKGVLRPQRGRPPRLKHPAREVDGLEVVTSHGFSRDCPLWAARPNGPESQSRRFREPNRQKDGSYAVAVSALNRMQHKARVQTRGHTLRERIFSAHPRRN